MSWWNKLKKIRLVVIIGLVICASIMILVLWLRGPVVGNNFCTLAGCLGGLDIVVEGLSNGEVYDLKVTLNNRDLKQTCVVGKDESQFPQGGCTPTGATFTLNDFILSQDEVPPEKIAVTVTVDGKEYSEVFYPTYNKMQPNGKDCDPVCYGATLIMRISK